MTHREGVRFGYLTVIRRELVMYGSRRRSVWLCKCDCGESRHVMTLVIGKKYSCGCKRGELITEKNTGRVLRPQEAPEIRFSRLYEKADTGCWSWTGAKNEHGYGTFRLGKQMGAHRASYLIHRGDIPKGMCVMHVCDNPGCVNPDHLTLGTHQDNMDDMTAKGRRRFPNQRGEKHSQHKLTWAAVNEIRRRYASGGVAEGVLAKDFAISERQIWSIVRGRAWQSP